MKSTDKPSDSKEKPTLEPLGEIESEGSVEKIIKRKKKESKRYYAAISPDGGVDDG